MKSWQIIFGGLLKVYSHINVQSEARVSQLLLRQTAESTIDLKWSNKWSEFSALYTGWVYFRLMIGATLKKPKWNVHQKAH